MLLCPDPRVGQVAEGGFESHKLLADLSEERDDFGRRLLPVSQQQVRSLSPELLV